MSDTKRMPVGFPADVHERLRETAHQRRISMSALVVEAVREKLGMTASEGGGDE